ncbi:MAG: hypothetical protein R3F36_15100 [Candidatus Competibacteraceae bacterium]
MLVIKTPSALSDATAVADALIQRLPDRRCCVIASFPGPITGQEARRHLLERQVPTYETASGAVRAFMRIVQYKRNQSLLMETPPSLPGGVHRRRRCGASLIADSLASGRRYLNEYEAMQALAARIRSRKPGSPIRRPPPPPPPI